MNFEFGPAHHSCREGGWEFKTHNSKLKTVVVVALWLDVLLTLGLY
jgi:hypothetical protein